MKKIILCLIVFLIPINTYALNDTATSSIIMDMDNNRILYSKNINERRLIASITKIMTCIVALDNGDLNKKITVGKEILQMYGTSIYLSLGEKMTLKDLLYGLMLRSGNDASVVIAKEIGKSEEKFVKLMNKKAKEIGMKNTIYTNPHGLDEKTHNTSTAKDMAILSSYAYNNYKVYREIIKTKEYETATLDKSYLWYNRNKLLSLYDYATGGKNGYTPSAGKTLVTTASKNNINLTIVTLNDKNEYNNHINLYNNIFDNYQNYLIIKKDNISLDNTYFKDELYTKNNYYLTLNEKEKDSLKTVLSLTKKSYKNKDIVGSINIYLEKKLIDKINVHVKVKKEEKKSLLENIKSIFTKS